MNIEEYNDMIMLFVMVLRRVMFGQIFARVIGG